MTPTTRRYPRSLSEAFPDERASSGDWEEGHKASNLGHRVAAWLCVIIAGILLTGII